MTPNMKRLLMPLTLILLMAVLAGAVTSVAAAPAENPAQAPLAQNCQFFPETGYQVRDPSQDPWRKYRDQVREALVAYLAKQEEQARQEAAAQEEQTTSDPDQAELVAQRREEFSAHLVSDAGKNLGWTLREDDDHVICSGIEIGEAQFNRPGYTLEDEICRLQESELAAIEATLG